MVPTWIRKIVAAPVFEDEEKTRVAGLLNTILLIFATMTLVVVPCLAIIDPTTAMFNLPIGAIVVVMVLGLEFIMRRGYLRTASMLLVSFLLAVVTVVIYVFSGIRNNVASAYILVVAIAALLLGARDAAVFGLLSMLAALGVFYAEINGVIVIPIPDSVEFIDWLLLSAVLGMGILLLRYAVRSIAEGLEQARQEITERKRTEEALRVSEERFALAMRGANDGLFDWDIQNNTLYWSPRMKELLGYTDDELDVDFDTFEALLHPDDREHTAAAIEAHLKDRTPYDVEQRLRTKSGEYRWFRARAQSLWDEAGNPVRMTGHTTDITELKRAEEELAYMATHDALTGLPNRWLFDDRLALALAHAQRNRQKLAVMLLDLDHFKDVNDTLGHVVGDKLLQVVGKRLKSIIRKSDTVARMGGDEFMLVLLFPGIRGDGDAAKIGQRILEAFRKPFVFDDHEINITTSIGIAIYPDDGKDADTLMKNADIAMYRAKAQGRNNYQRYSAKGGRDR
jgi:diguanylate cyclase (GGDEF)-like protein/PAS domain S-box-containing protein